MSARSDALVGRARANLFEARANGVVDVDLMTMLVQILRGHTQVVGRDADDAVELVNLMHVLAEEADGEPEAWTEPGVRDDRIGERLAAIDGGGS